MTEKKEVAQTLVGLKYSDRARRALHLPARPDNPPTASRGVECTEEGDASTDRRLIVDWLDFTMHGFEQYGDALLVIQELFGAIEPCMESRKQEDIEASADGLMHMAVVMEKPVGWRGYSESGRICGSGRVAWHPLQKEMGVHVSLPSTALGAWAGSGGRGLEAVLAYLKAVGATFARLDMAYDDRIGAVKLDQFEKHLEAGAFSTRVHRQNCLIVRDLAGGRTFYFGDKTSEKRLRVYDKRAERRSVGEKVKGQWNRVELQLRGHAADEAVNLILAGEHDPVGMIRGFLDIKELGSADSNNRRREPAAWWLAFLEYASRLPIVLPDPGRTLSKLARWFAHQVAPSFALLWEALGGDYFAVQLEHGQYRWNDIHRAMLNAFRQSQLQVAPVTQAG